MYLNILKFLDLNFSLNFLKIVCSVPPWKLGVWRSLNHYNILWMECSHLLIIPMSYVNSYHVHPHERIPKKCKINLNRLIISISFFYRWNKIVWINNLFLIILSVETLYNLLYDALLYNVRLSFTRVGCTTITAAIVF